MRNNNEYSFSDGFGAGGGSGAPIIAPVFATTAPPVAGYAAPVAPVVGGGFGGFGGEGGLLGLLAGAALLGGNGFGGRRDCDGGAGEATINQSIFGTAVLSQLGDISAAVPMAALETQNAILESTASTASQINQVGLAQLAATSGVKDTVQNATTAILASNASQGEATRALITQLNTDNLNRLLTVSDLDRRDERSFARSREIEVNVTQNVNQQQAQLQAQAQQVNQFNSLLGVISNLANDLQYVKQTQSNINFGVQGTAGQTASASNTKVS